MRGWVFLLKCYCGSRQHNLFGEIARLNFMPTLSQRLFSSLPDGFFRLLARASARVYVDCADGLAAWQMGLPG